MCVYQDLLIVSLCNAMRDKGGTDLLDNLITYCCCSSQKCMDDYSQMRSYRKLFTKPRYN